MKKIERITRNIKANKELLKRIESENYSGIDDFINNAERYIKAIKEGRMINCIGSVSGSGMSRTIKFLECQKVEAGKYSYYNFYLFFKLTGHTAVSNSDFFRVNGCGMDMIFHTNYSIIHNLCELGFVNKKQCAVLCQMTPTTI